jgi:hypothetical protein
MTKFPSGALVKHMVSGVRYKVLKAVGGQVQCTAVDDDIQVVAFPEHLLQLVGGSEQQSNEARLLVIEDRLDKLEKGRGSEPIQTF